MSNNNEIWVFLSHSHEDYEKVRKGGGYAGRSAYATTYVLPQMSQ